MIHSNSHGVATGLFANLLIKAANVYKSPLHALKEYVQNSFDERETNRVDILIDKDRNRLVIFDDGPGLGGRMPKYYSDLVTLYYETIAQNEAPGCDLRDMMDDGTPTRTLEWLIRNIANSVKSDKELHSSKPNPKLTPYLSPSATAKNKRRQRATLGKFGIGLLSYLYFANGLSIESKPQAELAAQLGMTDDEAYRLTFPSRSELDQFLIGYKLEKLPQPLTNMFGDPLINGTVVTIDDISPDAWQTLTFDNIVKYMTEVFGQRLADSHVEIHVADVGGTIKKVPKQVINGVILIDSVIHSIDGTPCPILIYYNPKKNDLVPIVTKLKTKILGLDEIMYRGSQPVFEGFWISGKVGGSIAYEHHRIGDDNLFDTSKAGLLDTPARKHWIQQVKQFEKAIQAAIEELERDARNDAFNKSLEIINDSLRRALESQQLLLPSPGSKKNAPDSQTKSREQGESAPLTSIIVSVVDRAGRGVPGVKVSIRRPPHASWEKETGASGSMQIGKPTAGEYRVRIDTDIPVRGQPTQRFMIDPAQGVFGYRVRFTLETGAPETKIPMRNVEVVFTSWDDPDDPWKQNIATLGLISINNARDTKLRTLLDREHYSDADVLMAEYISSAIMEALNDPLDHGSRIRQSQLFAEIYLRVQESRSEGTRSRRKK